MFATFLLMQSLSKIHQGLLPCKTTPHFYKLLRNSRVLISYAIMWRSANTISSGSWPFALSLMAPRVRNALSSGTVCQGLGIGVNFPVRIARVRAPEASRQEISSSALSLCWHIRTPNMCVYSQTPPRIHAPRCTSGLCCSDGRPLSVHPQWQCVGEGQGPAHHGVGSPSLRLVAWQALALGPVKVLLSALKQRTADTGILYPSNGLLTHITCLSGFLWPTGPRWPVDM